MINNPSNNPGALVLNDHWIPLTIEDHWSLKWKKLKSKKFKTFEICNFNCLIPFIVRSIYFLRREAFSKRLCHSVFCVLSVCVLSVTFLHFTLFVWEKLTSVSERDIFTKTLPLFLSEIFSLIKCLKLFRL